MSVNISFWIILPGVAGDGAMHTQQCPAFDVPSGCTVRVFANNKTAAGNGNIVYIGQYAEQKTDGDSLPNGQEKVFPVKNTGRIFITGNSADGVQVSIKSNTN